MSPRGDSTALAIECHRELTVGPDETEMNTCQHLRKTNKRVGFRGHAEVVEIPSRCCISESDQSCMWYSQQELALVKEELFATMKIMAVQGSIPEDEEKNLCSDGLQTPDEYEQRKVVAREAIQEVLLEQLFQWEDNIFDDEMIADIYFECTCQSQLRAMKQGEELARAVRASYGS